MPEIHEIIASIEKAYSSLSTYRDEGSVKAYVESKHESLCMCHYSFKTLVAVPQRYLFEFRDQIGREPKSILSLGPDHWSCNFGDTEGQMTFSHWRHVVAMLTKGASSFVTRLIFGDLDNWPQKSLADFRFNSAASEVDEDTELIRLKNMDDETITVERNSFLIRGALVILRSGPTTLGQI